MQQRQQQQCLTTFKLSWRWLDLWTIPIAHIWPDLKKPSFHTHNIKLTISPEMDYWLNTLSYSTAYLVPKSWVWFLWQLFIDPVSALSGTLAPLDGHDSLVLVLGGLANVCYFQFGVLWAQERSGRAPLAFNCFCIPFCTSIIKLTLHPPPTISITTTCNIIIVMKKAVYHESYWLTQLYHIVQYYSDHEVLGDFDP